MAKKKTVVDETPIAETQVIEADNIGINIDNIVESISNVNTNIETDTKIEEIADKIKEELKPIQEIAEKINEISTAESNFNQSISKNPEMAEQLVKEEIQKAEQIKTELDKIINSTNVKTNKKVISNMTNWWNGMGYDF